jgi:hypothetical protein
MDSKPGRFVPKVHPATRPVEAEDPMELCATPVAGDPDVLIRALVQEYAWMGWDAGQILELFRDPFYPMLHSLWQALGQDEIRQRIERVFREQGVYRFHCVVHEAPVMEEPAVVQIGPLQSRERENRHGAGL